MVLNTLELKFNNACNLIKIYPKTLKNTDLLYLYAMYKQVVIGNCNILQPSLYDFKKYAKWNEWNNNKDITKTVAMAFYISKVDELYNNLNV
jgi:acyl-CoA-binding protein|tara:strand:+ start:2477 stop:2752 length:276 start_codon:yes stop_codon:yes gene_type:complete